MGRSRQKARPLAVEPGRKGRLDIAFGAGVEDQKLQPERMRRPLHVSLIGLGNRIARVDEHGNERVAVGTKSCSNSSRFAASSLLSVLTPVTLPPGRLRLATRPSLTGSSPVKKTIGTSWSQPWPREPRCCDGDDHGDLLANQIGRQRR